MSIENSEKPIIIEEKTTKPNGELIVKRYLRGKLLGKGGFAKCYELTNLDNKKVYAAKIVAKSSLTKNKARQKLISEIKIHKSLKNSGIVSFEHVFEDHENVYILLELCSRNTLKELLKKRKRLTEIEVKCYLNQILPTLKYLKNNLIIHRDLKLGNFFLNEKMEIKLGDFGLAYKLEKSDDRRKSVCGTPNYIAPEILNAEAYDFQVDVWSLGVIVYTLLVGKPPYETADVQTTYQKIKKMSYSFPENIYISPEAKYFMKRIFINSEERAKIEELEKFDFLCGAEFIPALMPISTINCPPSISFLKSLTSPTSHNYQSMKLLESYNKVKSNIDQIEKPLISSPKQLRPEKIETENIMEQNISENIDNKSQKLELSSIRKDSNEDIEEKKQFDKFEIYIKKWVDYSNKYGIGFLLMNGDIGVYFNDSTKIVAKSNTNNIVYIEKNILTKQEEKNFYEFDNYPVQLERKIILLQNFMKYLVSNTDKNFEDFLEMQTVYIKKWMKTKHAILFRLSNKIIQVFFKDNSQILLNSDSKLILFIDQNGYKNIYPINISYENGNSEFYKKFQYTKEILNHIANNSKNDKHKENKI